MNKNLVREHTILFTEKCPLQCHYCHNIAQNEEQKIPDLNYESLKEKIQDYIEQDTKEGFITQILLTGGEPFLCWGEIKKVIMKFPDIKYHFNTSGFLLTQDIIEFLSNFDVYFNLSVDGFELLTNYLRPVKCNPGGIGYSDKIKEIAPILLYYFPQTEFKAIIGPYYIDTLYDSYLFANDLGFKVFYCTIDFNSRPNDQPESMIYSPIWTEEHTKELIEQFHKIAQLILTGWCNGIQYTIPRRYFLITKFLLNNKQFDLNNYPCKIFNNRSSFSIFGTFQNNGNCLVPAYFLSINEAAQECLKEWEINKGICPRDNSCTCYEFCANNSCIAQNKRETGHLLTPGITECAMIKAEYQSLMPLLSSANLLCKNSYYYKKFLRSLLERKEN